MTPLYHYTCRDGLEAIKAAGWVLKASPQALFPLVWLTDMEEPDRRALGLTSYSLTCDRTEFRLTVSDSDAVPWSTWCRTNYIPRRRRDLLELADGARPRHWFVTPGPVLANALTVEVTE